eukprot:7306397-Pyramimonas_sp.AAC.2
MAAASSYIGLPSSARASRSRASTLTFEERKRKESTKRHTRKKRKKKKETTKQARLTGTNRKIGSTYEPTSRPLVSRLYVGASGVAFW